VYRSSINEVIYGQRSLKSQRLNHLSFIHHIAAVNNVVSYIYFYNYKRLHHTREKMAEVKKSVESTVQIKLLDFI
jgi:hypothetical protein